MVANHSLNMTDALELTCSDIDLNEDVGIDEIEKNFSYEWVDISVTDNFRTNEIIFPKFYTHVLFANRYYTYLATCLCFKNVNCTKLYWLVRQKKNTSVRTTYLSRILHSNAKIRSRYNVLSVENAFNNFINGNVASDDQVCLVVINDDVKFFMGLNVMLIGVEAVKTSDTDIRFSLFEHLTPFCCKLLATFTYRSTVKMPQITKTFDIINYVHKRTCNDSHSNNQSFIYDSKDEPIPINVTIIIDKIQCIFHNLYSAKFKF